MGSLYHVLGLPNFASSVDVKKAFRKLAVQYHPDKHQGDRDYEEKFKSINRAYQTLSNPSKKELYDQRLLYNAQQKNSLVKPVEKTHHPKPKNGRAHEPIIKEQQKKKDPPRLTHTPLQLQLMRLIGLICCVFIFIAVSAQFLKKDLEPLANLKKLEKYHISSTQKALNKNQLYRAELFLDTLTLLNKYSTTRTNLENTVLTKWDTRIEKDRLNKKSVIKHVKDLERFSAKHGYLITGKYYLYWAEGLFTSGKKEEETLAKLKQAKKAGLTLTETCIVSNIYLDLGLDEMANGVIMETKTKIFRDFYRLYGPGFFETIESKTIEKEIFKELVQFAVLNENKTKKRISSTLLHHLLQEKLKKTEHHEMFDELLSINFQKSAVTAQMKEKNKTSLIYFNLYHYY